MTENAKVEEEVIEDGPSLKDQVLAWGYESVEDFYAHTNGKWEF